MNVLQKVIDAVLASRNKEVGRIFLLGADESGTIVDAVIVNDEADAESHGMHECPYIPAMTSGMLTKAYLKVVGKGLVVTGVALAPEDQLARWMITHEHPYGFGEPLLMPQFYPETMAAIIHPEGNHLWMHGYIQDGGTDLRERKWKSINVVKQ